MANRIRRDQHVGSTFWVAAICAALGAFLVFRPVMIPLKESSAPPNEVRLSQQDRIQGPSIPEVASLLPEPDVLLTITRRAVRDILHEHDGFLPSIAAVRMCYENLPQDDLDQSVYCLQLDRAAWLIQNQAPPKFQARDRLNNQYLEDETFEARQSLHTGVFVHQPHDPALRRAVLTILQIAMKRVFDEELRTGAPQNVPAASLPNPPVEN